MAPPLFYNFFMLNILEIQLVMHSLISFVILIILIAFYAIWDKYDWSFPSYSFMNGILKKASLKLFVEYIIIFVFLGLASILYSQSEPIKKIVDLLSKYLLVKIIYFGGFTFLYCFSFWLFIIRKSLENN